MSELRYVPFGERVASVVPLSLPLEEVTVRFRQAVWNLGNEMLAAGGISAVQRIYNFYKKMSWDKRWPMDGLSRMSGNKILEQLGDWLRTEAEWHEVYEFIESFSRWAELQGDGEGVWEQAANSVLDQELSPYRFVNHKLVPMVNESERQAVIDAMSLSGKFSVSVAHLDKALKYFSLRPKADYENGLKEAVLARNSLQTKAGVVSRYIREGIVPAGDPVAIAINVHDVPWLWTDIDEYMQRSLYGLGDLIVAIDPKTRKVVDTQRQQASHVVKSNKAGVGVQPFIDGSMVGVAAVLAAGADCSNLRAYLGQDFVMFPNLTATVPWTTGAIKLGQEWSFAHSKDGWDGNRTSYPAPTRF